MTEERTTRTTPGDRTMSEPDPTIPWTEADLTTEEEADRNVHSVASAKQLRERAEQLAASASN